MYYHEIEQGNNVLSLPDWPPRCCDVPVIELIQYLICLSFLKCYFSQCVNLLNMFTKHELKLEMFVAVCWSYSKWCISIVRRTVSFVHYCKDWILILLYKLSLLWRFPQDLKVDNYTVIKKKKKKKKKKGEINKSKAN